MSEYRDSYSFHGEEPEEREIDDEVVDFFKHNKDCFEYDTVRHELIIVGNLSQQEEIVRVFNLMDVDFPDVGESIENDLVTVSGELSTETLRAMRRSRIELRSPTNHMGRE